MIFGQISNLRATIYGPAHVGPFFGYSTSSMIDVRQIDAVGPIALARHASATLTASRLLGPTAVGVSSQTQPSPWQIR